MPERSSKLQRREDPNMSGFRVVLQEGTTEGADAGEVRSDPARPRDKNPAAVALGKLGGIKGGPARAKKLSKERRAEIARKAAAARWTKRSDKT